MAITKSTTTLKAGMKRPRSVRFNNTVKHVIDNTQRDAEQLRSTWYNKSDFTAMKTEIRTDIHNFLSGKATLIESNTQSWRGLEAYTQKCKKFQKHRRERRGFLVQGVKDLQRRLKAEGLSPESAISKLSTIASKSSVLEAQTLAQQDSLDANQIFLDTFLCPNADDKLASELPCMVAPHHDDIVSHQQLVTARTA